MKTLVSIFALCAVLMTGTVTAANPTVLTIKTDAEVKLENEISHLIAYPKVFGQQSRGEVLVRFRVDGSNRITDVRVVGGSEDLNRRIQQQLAGKRLKGADYSQTQSYNIRLKYQTVG